MNHIENKNDNSNEIQNNIMNNSFRNRRKLSDWIEMGSSHDPADERTSIESNYKKRNQKFD